VPHGIAPGGVVSGVVVDLVKDEFGEPFHAEGDKLAIGQL